MRTRRAVVPAIGGGLFLLVGYLLWPHRRTESGRRGGANVRNVRPHPVALLQERGNAASVWGEIDCRTIRACPLSDCGEAATGNAIVAYRSGVATFSLS